MATLTIRDIPEDVLDRIRMLSERERRSLNKEFLVVVEDGLRTHSTELDRSRDAGVSPHLQAALWRDIAGKWEDERTTAEIVADLRRARTPGREVSL